MKKIAVSIVAIFAYAALNAASSIYVVDMGEVYKNYYKAKEAAAQINASVETTKQELQKMAKSREDLIKQAQEIDAKLKSDALSKEKKEEIAQKELQPKVVEIQQLEANMRNIQEQAQQRLQQNANNIRQVHMQEIKEIVEKLAKEKKADFIVEKGVCYFSQPSADLTQDLIKAVNASAPATAAK